MLHRRHPIRRSRQAQTRQGMRDATLSDARHCSIKLRTLSYVWLFAYLQSSTSHWLNATDNSFYEFLIYTITHGIHQAQSTQHHQIITLIFIIFSFIYLFNTFDLFFLFFLNHNRQTNYQIFIFRFKLFLLVDISNIYFLLYI